LLFCTAKKVRSHVDPTASGDGSAGPRGSRSACPGACERDWGCFSQQNTQAFANEIDASVWLV